MTSDVLSNSVGAGSVGLDSVGRKLATVLIGQGREILAFDGNASNLQSFRAPHTVLVSGNGSSEEGLQSLFDQLAPDDLLIDASQCHFKECAARARHLDARGVRYLEITGNGVTLMVGGRQDVFLKMLPLLETPGAGGEPGAPRLQYAGPASAAHFVKMSFEGLEHVLAALSREITALLQRTSQLTDEQLRVVVKSWQPGESQGAANETAARQLCQTAHEWAVPAPTLASAVGMRRLTRLDQENELASTPSRQPVTPFAEDPAGVLGEMRGALRAATLIAYAQAVAMLAAAAGRGVISIDLWEIFGYWKEGLPLRGPLLDEIAAAWRATPNLENLLHDDDLSEQVMEHQENLRHTVWRAGQMGIAAPGLAASLDYLDAQRGAWLPVNLIQPHAIRREAPIPWAVVTAVAEPSPLAAPVRR